MRRDPDAHSLLNDCKACMECTTRTTRQSIGCGFEPPAADRTRVMTWRPELFAYKDAPKDLAPETCVGYLQQLPEIREVARARVHWNKGALQLFTMMMPPRDELLAAIEILEASANDVQQWLMTPKSEGGGGR